MRTEKNVYKRMWFLILGLIILTECLIVAGDVLFPNAAYIKGASVFCFLCSLFVLFLFFRGMDRTVIDLQKDKQRLDSIFDTLDVAIWSHDLKADTLMITPGIEKLYGYPLIDFYKDHELWKKVIHPEDLPVIAERNEQFLRGEIITSIYRIIRPDGEVRWIQDRGIPTINEQGQFSDFNSVLFDITDRKESEGRYRSLVEMSPDIIAVFSKGKIDYINEAGCRLFGAKRIDEIVGQPISRFISPDIFQKIKDNELGIESSEKGIFGGQFQAIKLDGTAIDIEASAMPIFYEGRVVNQVVGRDISQRKRAEKTIQFMAYHDTLTGLPNRNMFRKHLTKVLNQPDSHKLAVLFLDLDRFKIINDTKGHTIGDLILKKVAERLSKAVFQAGMVSRQGGDEFIIMLENADKEKAAQIAGCIVDQFVHPIELGGQEFYVTPSIGISIYPDDGNDEETLIKLADTAMYLAKEHGKNNFKFYSSHLNMLASRKMELENGLRKAVELNQLKLFYQPQVELTTGEIVGIEALIRWKHPELGWISPSEFIPLAEETGLIIPIGKWVLQTACKQNKTWQNTGLMQVPVGVNISVRQFQDDQFVESVKGELAYSGLEPNLLELEITESIMQNIEKSSMILNQLKDLGVKLSIDDFGTGYSSLSYLNHLPINILKIDKSFVDGITQDNTQGAIVKTIIDMGHNLNFQVVAEGIETKEQVTFLIENACRIGQGYFFSKPVPPEQIETIFSEFLIK
ncbi:GGDEF domain-containing protein [Bacillus sp. M6-12]|uniref:sensor domain-containing protein n=1 Tax=Bacillus sp. M6-12 TaxID=2054166 RepID=UPI000C77F807|nr:bifunctional diguanylate cyclase/phosphodiesterase [Bacillus sp. M6-12]PLS17668.1 GGDEF domain-containing protein [Bacillus sp. M6-12]